MGVDLGGGDVAGVQAAPGSGGYDDRATQGAAVSYARGRQRIRKFAPCQVVSEAVLRRALAGDSLAYAMPAILGMSGDLHPPQQVSSHQRARALCRVIIS